MNIENINLLIDTLRSPRAAGHFDMNQWLVDAEGKEFTDTVSKKAVINECGTVACIGGWCDVLAEEQGFTTSDQHSSVSYAAEWLGISYSKAFQLFYPSDGKMYELTNPLIAARVVEHLRDTGGVNWSIIDV